MRGLLSIGRCLCLGFNSKRSRAVLKETASGVPGLSRNERSAMASGLISAWVRCRSAEDPLAVLSEKKTLGLILSACRAGCERSERKAKGASLRSGLKDPSKLFFVCSWHPGCANDHKPYQGRIYVDRFWRRKAKGSEYPAVLEYIRKHGTMTVQEAIRGPIWLTTRPYCRHRFIPVDTPTVLNSRPSDVTKALAIDRSKGFPTAERDAMIRLMRERISGMPRRAEWGKGKTTR